MVLFLIYRLWKPRWPPSIAIFHQCYQDVKKVFSQTIPNWRYQRLCMGTVGSRYKKVVTRSVNWRTDNGQTKNDIKTNNDPQSKTQNVECWFISYKHYKWPQISMWCTFSIHFLMKCTLYKNERDCLFRNLRETRKNIETLLFGNDETNINENSMIFNKAYIRQMIWF